jgi:signal transduction histidine kinase
MSNLISELLMIARADRGALEFNWEKVDLSLLAEECCDRIRQPADQRSIRVRVMAKEGIYAECDRLLMGKALDNLLTNAVKYGRDGGFVRVSVEEQGSDAVRITVEDDGIGIPQKEQERIWDRFYRAENAKAFLGTGGEDESMGLGLAFVRWVATAHGGKVICESVQGQGSRFLLTIPLMHV